MRDAPSRTGSYVGVYAALLALTGATVLIAFRDLGAWNQPVALAIASLKALLVAAVFMHLKSATTLTRVFAAAGVVWLILLIGLSYADFRARAGRGPIPGFRHLPKESAEPGANPAKQFEK